MISYDAQLGWIDGQRDRMERLVTAWASVNSGSHHVAGLRELSVRLKREFTRLGGEMTDVALPPYRTIDAAGNSVLTPVADAISIRTRPDAPLRVFLGIHMDTVYGPENAFQNVERVDGNTLRGPGVADAKGGLAVMLVALEALERSPVAARIGWEVLINPDEELGSPSSAPLFEIAAKRNHLGMVFEPALPDGTLVGQRKGSGNFTAIVRGRSAHAGRDFHAGRNAMHAAARLVGGIEGLNRSIPDATFNVGKIDGGGPSNVVPDLAIVRFNVRIARREDQPRVEAELRRAVESIDQSDGISVQLGGGFFSPPKPLDAGAERLFQHVAECGRELGMSIRWRDSGGVCDGNKLAAAGLAVVDTLGPRGGNLHSPGEYLLLDSLTERAKLSALLLLKLADGEIAWGGGGGRPIP